MNRDDRIALVDMGRSFVPEVFESVDDPGTLLDSALLDLMRETMTYLQTQAESQVGGAIRGERQAQNLEPAIDLEGVLRREEVKYHYSEVVETDAGQGRRRRRWEAMSRAAEVDDVLGMTLTPQGRLSIVVSDGKAYEFAI